jgi:hypothetical protein
VCVYIFEEVSLVTGTGFTVMTLRQSKNPSKLESKVKSMNTIFFNIKGTVHKGLVLAG